MLGCVRLDRLYPRMMLVPREFPRDVGEIVSGVWYYPTALAWGVAAALANWPYSARPGNITRVDGPLGFSGRVVKGNWWALDLNDPGYSTEPGGITLIDRKLPIPRPKRG